MNRSIEAIPTWALCYIINGDASGLTDEEIRMPQCYPVAILFSLTVDQDR